MVSEESKLDVL